MDVIAKYRKLYFNEIYRNRRFHDRLEEGISLFHTRSDVIYIAFRFYRHKTVLLCRRVRITPKKNSQKWCKANGWDNTWCHCNNRSVTILGKTWFTAVSHNNYKFAFFVRKLGAYVFAPTTCQLKIISNLLHVPSHFSPFHPDAQEHSKLAPDTAHWPSLWHGFGKQGFLSVSLREANAKGNSLSKTTILPKTLHRKQNIGFTVTDFRP